MPCLLLCHMCSPTWSAKAVESQPNTPHQGGLCILAVGRRWPQETNAQLCSLCQFSSPSDTPHPCLTHSPLD